jgi:hypothetical protein
MSLSDCPKCWDTPCECGYEYRGWTRERREALAAKLLDPPFNPDGSRRVTDVNSRQPVTYYKSGVNCPGCAGTNWHIGRTSAECGRCGWSLPLAP